MRTRLLILLTVGLGLAMLLLVINPVNSKLIKVGTLIVYFGGGRWVHADPGLRKVAILHGREDENNWFKIPVTIHRWMILQTM